MSAPTFRPGQARDTHLLLRQQVLGRRVVGLVVTRQRGFGRRQVHAVFGQDGGILPGPQVVVAPPAERLRPPGLNPAHLDGVHQSGDLLLLHQRGDEAALVLGSVGDRVDHHLAAEELHLRLKGRSRQSGGACVAVPSQERRRTSYSLKPTSPNCPFCSRLTSSTCSWDRTRSPPVCWSRTVLLQRRTASGWAYRRQWAWRRRPHQ